MLRFLTAGESHGPELTVIIDGLPAGIPLKASEIAEGLARRQKGEGSGGRMSIEKDRAKITGGVMAGITTGAPISLVIPNRDFSNWRDRDVAPITVPRPGHVDLGAALKYGYKDLRVGLERASARETAARVAMGVVCKKFLSQFGIVIGSHVIAIGNIQAPPMEMNNYCEVLERVERSPVRCANEDASILMVREIRRAINQGDTLGGSFQCVGLNIPPGLGSHVQWDRRLSSQLFAALGSIPSVKAVQFGDAIGDSVLSGSEVHDEIVIKSDAGTDTLCRKTNRAGGVEGGISNGMPLLVTATMKPISTTSKGIPSVNLRTRETCLTVYERSDTCAVPRACVVGEAMMALVVAEALIEKVGGDSIEEMSPRFSTLTSMRLDDIHLEGVAWRFAYEVDV